MKILNVVIIVTTIAILAVATVGVALADNGGIIGFGGMMGLGSSTDDYWWNEMQEHMDDHMDEVQDEEWNSDIRAYINEHLDDVENQDWFSEMTQYMEDNTRGGYGNHDCR